MKVLGYFEVHTGLRLIINNYIYTRYESVFVTNTKTQNKRVCFELTLKYNLSHNNNNKYYYYIKNLSTPQRNTVHTLVILYISVYTYKYVIKRFQAS